MLLLLPLALLVGALVAADGDGLSSQQMATKTMPAQPSHSVLADETQVLRRQIAACWTIPEAVKARPDTVVELLVELNPDRSVLSYEVMDQSRYANDALYKTAADSAVKALQQKECRVLNVSEGGYKKWRLMRLVFDPQA